MADRYQRYKTKGLALRMPTVDFSFEKTRSNNLAGLSNSLDRMAEVFFRNATQTAKIEGAEYGALNAPTEKQLLDASESNTELDFVGDKDTVFGRYARTATLEATSDKLTLIAKEKIAEVMLDAKVNDTSPTEVSKQLDSITSGLSDVLDNESPVTSKKFKATMGIYANAEYKTYASKYITDKQKELRKNWVLNYENVLTNGLPKIIQSGFPKAIPSDITKDGKTVYKDTNIVTTKQILETQKKKLLASMPIGVSPSEALAYEKRFDDHVLQSAKDVVYDSIFRNQDPRKIVDFIENNKLDKLPIAIQSAFSVVAGENKAVLKKIAKDAYYENLDNIEKNISHNNIVRENTIKTLDVNASQALLNPNPTEGLKSYKSIITQMFKLDPKKANEMQEILNQNPSLKYAPNSKSSIFDKVSLAFNEKEVIITQATLNKYLLERKLSKSDYDTFSKNLTARNNTEFNRALADARSRLKVPVSILGNSAVMKSWQFNTLKDIEEGMYRARRDDVNFVASVWLEQNYLAYKKNGEVTELDILQELGGDYLNKENLNRLINLADGERKTELISIRTRIESWNATQGNTKIKGY